MGEVTRLSFTKERRKLTRKYKAVRRKHETALKNGTTEKRTT